MSALAGTVEHHGHKSGSSVPRVPDVFVPRGRLVDSVESGVGRGMVIVSAPAGSGKTLLLASWAAQRSTAPAWLSVEPEDADPARFWARVLSSLQHAPGLPSGSPLSTLRVPPTFDDRFVGVLLAACDEVPGTRVLV
ncbi:MAG: LuxR C-terminal-related transcriptional regulator, partial [Actinomycetota bacterium]